MCDRFGASPLKKRVASFGLGILVIFLFFACTRGEGLVGVLLIEEDPHWILASDEVSVLGWSGEDLELRLRVLSQQLFYDMRLSQC
jgi:hypothetical protein